MSLETYAAMLPEGWATVTGDVLQRILPVVLSLAGIYLMAMGVFQILTSAPNAYPIDENDKYNHYNADHFNTMILGVAWMICMLIADGMYFVGVSGEKILLKYFTLYSLVGAPCMAVTICRLDSVSDRELVETCLWPFSVLLLLWGLDLHETSDWRLLTLFGVALMLLGASIAAAHAIYLACAAASSTASRPGAGDDAVSSVLAHVWGAVVSVVFMLVALGMYLGKGDHLPQDVTLALTPYALFPVGAFIFQLAYDVKPVERHTYHALFGVLLTFTSAIIIFNNVLDFNKE